jgi:hypothetical protein
MNAPNALPADPEVSASRRRRRLLLAGIALGPFLLLLGGFVFFIRLGEQQLQELLAETDRLDPGWRLEELEAARATVPDNQNAALRVLTAYRLLPKTGRDPEKLVFPASRQLTSEEIQRLRQSLRDATDALTEARKLNDLPRGRYAIVYRPEYIGTPLPHLPMTREIGGLLAEDAILRAQEGDTDGALASCRGMLNAGRSVGDEPFAFSQFRRLDLRSAACDKLERVLAQGEPSETALASAQALLEDEAEWSLFLAGARADRAGWDRLCRALKQGEVQVNGLHERILMAALGSGFMSGSSRRAILQVNTQIVELAKLPVEAQQEALSRHPLPDGKALPFFAREYIYPKIQKTLSDLRSGNQRTLAELRCAAALLSAERYRKARGDWPKSLADLVPDFLPSPLVDPYAGVPLRLRRLADGLVIYCVGPDERDNGGVLDRSRRGAAGTDLGYRLSDVGQRRQPAPEKSP